MSKLNQPGKPVTDDIFTIAVRRGEEIGLSKNGNVQFVKEPLQHLYELVVSTMFGKDTYYASSNQLVEDAKTQLRAVVAMGEFDFVANLIVHARSEMNIRTMPLVMVVEFARELRDQGKQYANMRRLVNDTIQRADQITDLYAYALHVFGDKGKIPTAIKRGVGDAFNKFNEYHYGKYSRDGAVKFRDVLRIVHPQSKDVNQGLIFEKIMKETLEVPYTWEVELSKNGQLPSDERKSPSQMWTELVSSGKLGYMALLRNLRNICQAGIAKDVMETHVCKVLRDPEAVKKNRQLPFAYMQAYRALQSIAPAAPRSVLNALSDALELSCANIPQIGDDIVLLVDSSGSMQGGYGFRYSGKIDAVSPADYASVFAAMLLKANQNAYKVTVIYFDSSARFVNINTNDSIIGITEKLRELSRGGSTDLGAALSLMEQHNLTPDTVVVLSDMQVDGMYMPNRTLKSLSKNCIKIAINFEAQNTTPLSVHDGWYQMAGWSDNMFKFIPAMRGKVTVVDTLRVPYGSRKSDETFLYAPSKQH